MITHPQDDGGWEGPLKAQGSGSTEAEAVIHTSIQVTVCHGTGSRYWIVYDAARSGGNQGFGNTRENTCVRKKRHKGQG